MAAQGIDGVEWRGMQMHDLVNRESCMGDHIDKMGAAVPAIGHRQFDLTAGYFQFCFLFPSLTQRTDEPLDISRWLFESEHQIGHPGDRLADIGPTGKAPSHAPDAPLMTDIHQAWRFEQNRTDRK